MFNNKSYPACLQIPHIKTFAAYTKSLIPKAIPLSFKDVFRLHMFSNSNYFFLFVVVTSYIHRFYLNLNPPQKVDQEHEADCYHESATIYFLGCFLWQRCGKEAIS